MATVVPFPQTVPVKIGIRAGIHAAVGYYERGSQRTAWIKTFISIGTAKQMLLNTLTECEGWNGSEQETQG